MPNGLIEHRCCNIADELANNIDSVVTIYTEGSCFTGLLVGVTDCLVKLIVRCAPGCPSRCNYFGKITIIRICSIEAVTFCNTSM